MYIYTSTSHEDILKLEFCAVDLADFIKDLLGLGNDLRSDSVTGNAYNTLTHIKLSCNVISYRQKSCVLCDTGFCFTLIIGHWPSQPG